MTATREGWEVQSWAGRESGTSVIRVRRLDGGAAATGTMDWRAVPLADVGRTRQAFIDRLIREAEATCVR